MQRAMVIVLWSFRKTQTRLVDCFMDDTLYVEEL